jgi:thiamine kinase-like enzyme
LRDSSHVTIDVENGLIFRARENQGVARDRMEREIELCRFLSEHDAPVTRPSHQPEPGPYEMEDWLLSYWNKEDEIHENSENRNILKIGEALSNCHQAMVNYPGSLPDFREKLKSCFNLLQIELVHGPLPVQDFEFLHRTYVLLEGRLNGIRYREQPLHGDCHLGNVIKTPRGYLWTDFETACRGPLEWDLAFLPEGIIPVAVDAELQYLLKNFCSWCTAVWSWAAYDRSEEKRIAAHHHLQQLKIESKKGAF